MKKKEKRVCVGVCELYFNYKMVIKKINKKEIVWVCVVFYLFNFYVALL